MPHSLVNLHLLVAISHGLGVHAFAGEHASIPKALVGVPVREGMLNICVRNRGPPLLVTHLDGVDLACCVLGTGSAAPTPRACLTTPNTAKARATARPAKRRCPAESNCGRHRSCRRSETYVRAATCPTHRRCTRDAAVRRDGLVSRAAQIGGQPLVFERHLVRAASSRLQFLCCLVEGIRSAERQTSRGSSRGGHEHPRSRGHGAGGLGHRNERCRACSLWRLGLHRHPKPRAFPLSPGSRTADKGRRLPKTILFGAKTGNERRWPPVGGDEGSNREVRQAGTNAGWAGGGYL